MTDPADSWPQLDVVAVGAHPDDVEIACGGTLARLVEQGHSVGIIDLTNGEPTPLCPDPQVRLAEAAAAAAALGVETRVTLELPNRRLFDSHEARLALASEFRKYRPRLVLGFGDRTPMASPDHWQAMQITDAAIFYPGSASGMINSQGSRSTRLTPNSTTRSPSDPCNCPLRRGILCRISAARSRKKWHRLGATRRSFRKRKRTYLSESAQRPTILAQRQVLQPVNCCSVPELSGQTT